MLPPPIQNKIIEAVSFEYEEIWLPMNYELYQDIRKIYYISNYGRVFSKSHNKFLSQEISNTGYYRVNLIRISNVNHPQHCNVHRLVLETFNPVNNMKDLFVNHIDGIKTNNILTNLEWTTPKENTRHAIRNQLVNWKKGNECSWKTIDENIADNIGYYLSLNKYSYKEIANKFNCSETVVQNIYLGISWRHIYFKYKLYKYRKRIKSRFSKIEYNILTDYIIKNINNYNNIDDYRGLCIDACSSINIFLDRDKYIELLDFIYNYNDKIT